jgi:hypothetical protein
MHHGQRLTGLAAHTHRSDLMEQGANRPPHADQRPPARTNAPRDYGTSAYLRRRMARLLHHVATHAPKHEEKYQRHEPHADRDVL